MSLSGQVLCVRNVIKEAPGLYTITCFGEGVALESDLGGGLDLMLSKLASYFEPLWNYQP